MEPVPIRFCLTPVPLNVRPRNQQGVGVAARCRRERGTKGTTRVHKKFSLITLTWQQHHNHTSSSGFSFTYGKLQPQMAVLRRGRQTWDKGWSREMQDGVMVYGISLTESTCRIPPHPTDFIFSFLFSFSFLLFSPLSWSVDRTG